MKIALRPMNECPWYLRPFFWNQRRKYGRVLDAARLWAHAPLPFLGVALLYGAIDRKHSPVSPVLRSLITVRVSQLNGCRFCVDLNTATLMKRGVTQDKVNALESWRVSELFTSKEKDALAYAEAVTLSDRHADDDLIGRLREHFDNDEIIELTALIAFQNMSSKFNSALGVPSQGFCWLPGMPWPP